MNKELSCGFIGLGLIGGSIAKALHEQTVFPICISAYDTNLSTLQLAKSEEVVQFINTDIDSFLQRTYDILFLCAPVQENTFILKKLEHYELGDCIITDVGSVKNDIHTAVMATSLTSHFIGGHPMAGTENCGYENSYARMLQNAYYILTPAENVPEKLVTRLTDIVEIIGSIPLVLNWQEHDYAVAAISHLPHIVSASLVNLVRTHDNSEGLMKKIAAGGFRDITRISSSSPSLWKQISLLNKANLLRLLNDYLESLRLIKDQITEDSADELLQMFSDAREYRNSLSDSDTGLIRKDYRLFVDIPDIPGIIAKISTLLAEANINIKNIGILHNREFSEGALYIEFPDEDTLLLAKQLMKEYHYICINR